MKPVPTRFARVSQPYGAKHRTAWRIACTVCAATLDLTASFGDGKRDEGLAHNFRNRGWRVGKKPADDLCPACATAPRLRQPPAAAPHSPEPAAMPQTHEVPPAQPPAAPSREDRRAIHEAIDARWDAGRDAYAGSASDRSIGAALDRPWAWVAEVRAAFFGERDINTATLDGAVAADELIARAQAIEDRALALAADAETLRRDAAAWRKVAGV